MNANNEIMSLYGEAVRLVGRALPGMSILETERWLWYPIVLGQFQCIRHKNGGMTAFATWAYLSHHTMNAFANRPDEALALEEWNEGTLPTIIRWECQPSDIHRLVRAVVTRLRPTHDAFHYLGAASGVEGARELRHFRLKNRGEPK